MKRSAKWHLFLVVIIFSGACKDRQETPEQPVHEDVAFVQDFSVKYELLDSVKLRQVYCDRNGVIEISSSRNLLKPHAGKLLFPGTLVDERYYRPIADKKIANLTLYKNHFVYVDDKAVLSNAWAGNLYNKHTLPQASILAGGEDFDFFISDGKELQYLKDSTVAWKGAHTEKVLDIIFHPVRKAFFILSEGSISSFTPGSKMLKSEYTASAMTCFALSAKSNDLVVGTSNGYFAWNTESMQPRTDVQRKLPWTEITAVEEIDGNLWFGSTRGAFMLKEGGKGKLLRFETMASVRQSTGCREGS